MKTHLLILTLITSILFTACATTPDPRLLGTWKSNRALTLGSFPRNLPSNERPFFTDTLGKDSTTIGDRFFTAQLPPQEHSKGTTQRVHYRVVSLDRDSVIITQGASPERITLHFVSPSRYWVQWTDKTKIYYDRVSK